MGLPGQGARPMKVELTGIDPWRWALLHLPLGAITGIVVTCSFLKHKTNISSFIIAPLLFIPLGAIWGWLAGLLQAVVFNLYVQIMRRGPVFHLRAATTRARRDRWLAEKEAANKNNAREFVRDPNRTKETPPNERIEPDAVAPSEDEGREE
jgi:hypothetical protein